MKRTEYRINYENFPNTRPLNAKFKRCKYGISELWETKLTIEKASFSKILNIRYLSTKTISAIFD